MADGNELDGMDQNGNEAAIENATAHTTAGHRILHKTPKTMTAATAISVPNGHQRTSSP